ncbi:MAG: G5 domain-containing protein, partial [Finegoldia magna]|nr:G5 domain-containing protein [Finegoldia magna]
MKINKKLLMAALASVVIVSAPQVKAYTLSNAESVATNTELGRSEEKPHTAVRAPQEATDPNYANDEKNVGTYKETQLERGNGPASSYKPPTEINKFIDGYRYKNLEPGATSPDKTLWGFEIEFDREKGQRTYTDFTFTNSGLLGAFLPGGTNVNPVKVPSVEQGTKIGNDFKEANYKAESNIDLVASKSQRNLNLYASEEDLKHINSVDNNNTTMAWQGHYLKDNANGPKATEGDNAAFSFTVNPWPNENDKLSLITLSGSHDEKVFINGQTITTNVSVANLDSNARERLVGQVYNPETGQVVPGARAYINDQDKVVIEMPKGAVNDDGTINKDSIFYKDKNYIGLQSLKVRFFARPRTAEEFKAIISNNPENYGTYTETGAGTTTISHKGKDVVIDKQGIARYDHYNKVGEFTLNLDDTKYHDQDYIDEDGVKTSTSEVSYVRAGIPYIIKNSIQESIDDITDTVGKKHASASLDTSFLDKYNQGKDSEDQWKIVGNESLTEITITPPKNAKAGDYIPFSIRYTYTNGSVDVHKVSLIVKESENNIPQYYSQVLYPTETATSLPHLSIEGNDQDKRRPVRYTIEDKPYFDDQGNEWTASIDSATGIVTATPKVAKDFIGGEKLVVPVTAHYEEEGNPEITFTEQARAAFIIKQKDNLPPRYDAKNGKAGDTLTSDPIVKQDGGIDTRTPVSYSIDKTEYTDNKGNTWTVSIDEKTGVVTANIPNIKEGDKLDGTIISVPVTAHYEENGQDVGTEVANAQFLASGTNNKIEHVEKIPFEVKVEVNNELAKGEWRYKKVDGVEQKGQEGEIKTTWTIENSKIVDKTEEKTEPVAAIIEVGSKDFEGTLEYVDKDPIPFETEVIVDPNLAPNVIVEDQKGELGEKQTPVTREIKNGVAGEEKRGEATVTKEPVKRKIRVGSNTKGQYKETEIIPFKTEVRKDPTLKKGEWKYAEVDGVQQTGENGLKERVLTIENSQVTAESEYKTIKEPKNAVILVGDEDFTGKVEYVDKDPVPFETEVTIDTSLEPNQIVEDQAGVLGEQETKVTREIKNGEAGEEVRGETKQTKAPINRKIRIGAKSIGTHKIEEKVEIPFETVIEFDDSLKPGEQKVSQEGIPGEKTRTNTLTIENGKVIKTEEGEFTETKAPTKKIIKVGRNTEGEVKHVEEIPFKYEVKEVDTLKKGEYKIEKPGKVGTKTTTWTIKNSQIDGKPTEVIVEPEDALIYVGKGTNSGTHDVVEKVPVPFETIIEFDDNLAPGETKIVTEGSLGEKTRTNTLTIEDGKVTETKEGTFEQNIAPVNRVIKVGRNTNGKVEHKEELPFKYTIQYDPSLEAGKYVEETPGKVGERITTWTIENSKVVGEPSVVETKPVDAVIKVGSKDFTGTFTTTNTEAVPFETEYVVDETLEPGKVVEEQKGELGEKETPVAHTIKNGEVIESKEGESKQTKAPVKRIVKVGAAKSDGTHTYTSKKPFQVEVRVNPELKKGEYKVVQKGVEGEEEYTITIKDSKVTNTSEPKETKAPVNEIIEVGSQDFTGTHETKKTQAVQYETEYVVDDSLEPGTTKVEQEGSLGEETITVTHTIVNGQVTKSEESQPVQTKAPVKRIVKVGPAKTDGTHEYTNKIPYEVEIRVNPKLKKGERNVIQKGEPGEEKYTLTIENSKVVKTSDPERTKEPKPEIIEVGTEDYTGEFEYVDKEVIPFDTEVKINPNLAPNEIKEITPGENGSKERKVTQKYTNGEKGDLVVGEYEVTKQPVTRVIEVGSKTDGQYKETHVIPFETKVRTDSSIPKG